METTYINTLDGRTKVEWWGKDEFKGRVSQIISAHETVTIHIPDDSVVCDFCNERITELPVPVVGTYALCKECFENIQKEEEEE